MTTADHWGAFVVTNLPYSPTGFDTAIRARGYGPSRTVHSECVAGDLLVGNFPVARSPQLVDGSPKPAAR